MAQRIVTLCDAHQQHDEDTPGATWEVTLLAPGESKPTTWEVDLCEDDGKSLRDLAVMLGAVGRQTAGPKRQRPTAARASSSGSETAHTAPPDGSMVPAPCPVDGCDKVPASRKALTSHLRAYHGLSMAKAFGRPEPYACPEPGCDFTSARPQGIGAHRTQVHGYSAGESLAG